MTNGDTTVDRFTLGDTEVIRVIEWLGPITGVGDLFPATPAKVWDENAGWLDPYFYDKATSADRAAIQTWVVRTRGMTVLVDTGVGNDRDRPQVPLFDHLSTGFPARLAAAGITARDVDIVVNTHIHYDHVGWNTHRVDDEAAAGPARPRWAPTFPNATYLVPRADYEYFHPDNAAKMRPARTDDERRRFEGIRLVFADSIAPIEDAAQLSTWSGEHRLGDDLVLREAPGHTPGSSVLWLEDGPGAVFAGDLLHTPIQVLRPDDACSFDLDPAQARLSRRRVLAQAARAGSLVLPAHLAGQVELTLTTDPDTDGYAITGWAGLTPR